MMKTVLFCGGKGERLKEYEAGLPKPLWVIAGKPLLWHVMHMYARQGFDDFILCTGFKHMEFVRYFDENPEPRWKIIFDEQGEDTGTAARLRSALQFVDTENFFCNYADGLSDIRMEGLLHAHLSSGKVATLTAVKPTLPYGVVEMDDKGLVTRFSEKPIIDQWVNGGFFVFSTLVKKYLSGEGMLEQKPLSDMARDQQLHAYKHEGKWLCMDTYKDYVRLTKLMEDKQHSWLG